MLMPAWFRPWMLWLAGIALLAGLLAAQTVRLADTRTKLAEANGKITAMQRDHATALQVAESKARTKEATLREELDQLAADAATEKKNAKAREDALVESVRSGNRRLSIAARCVPAASAAEADPHSSPPGGTGPDVSRAELSQEAGLALVGIASDGNQAIRERNACFVAYEKVRQLLNAADAP